MPPTRPKLMLDEQSFQGLLAAAFTIQQYNDKKKTDASSSTVAGNGESSKPPAPETCRQCGASLLAGQSTCTTCGAESLRPGERLQRTWAAMWLMSQEQGLWPEPSASIETDLSLSDPYPDGRDDAGHLSAAEVEGPSEPLGNSELIPSTAFPDDDNSAVHNGEDNGATNDPATLAGSASPPRYGLLDLWMKLRSHRADLYLGIAVLIAAVALLWPSGKPQRPHLRPWERVLIAMGVAEAPQPAVHYAGNPNIKVWVDTHTALYYCPGDELYGKSQDGHYSTQHEAQQDRFEPAERLACE